MMSMQFCYDFAAKLIVRYKKNFDAKAYLEPCQASKIEFFVKIVMVEAVNYFRKKFNLRCLTGLCDAFKIF